MPFKVEHEGKEIEVWTTEEVDNEVKGLKITLDNIKGEKGELSDKLKEAKELARQAEEAKAKAEGDKATLERLQKEREDENREKYTRLVSETKNEKITNSLNEIINKYGAGGQHNEDLRDLLKTRMKFDYDIESREFTVNGEGVSSISDLEKVITSGRYDAYLKSSGSSGGGSQGGKGAGSAKTVSRSQFDEMSQADRSAFVKDGGKVNEDN
jgi:hypothetical protein